MPRISQKILTSISDVKLGAEFTLTETGGRYITCNRSGASTDARFLDTPYMIIETFGPSISVYAAPEDILQYIPFSSVPHNTRFAAHDRLFFKTDSSCWAILLDPLVGTPETLQSKLAALSAKLAATGHMVRIPKRSTLTAIPFLHSTDHLYTADRGPAAENHVYFLFPEVSFNGYSPACLEWEERLATTTPE